MGSSVRCRKVNWGTGAPRHLSVGKWISRSSTPWSHHSPRSSSTREHLISIPHNELSPNRILQAHIANGVTNHLCLPLLHQPTAACSHATVHNTNKFYHTQTYFPYTFLRRPLNRKLVAFTSRELITWYTLPLLFLRSILSYYLTQALPLRL
jgi:hypothetical protein